VVAEHMAKVKAIQQNRAMKKLIGLLIYSILNEVKDRVRLYATRRFSEEFLPPGSLRRMCLLLNQSLPDR
jgi:hypothetical protein